MSRSEGSTVAERRPATPGGVRRAPVVAVVVYPDDARNPSVWSGTPNGIVRGLERAGVEVKAISADLPPALELLAAGAVSLLRLPRATGDDLAARLRLSRRIARMGPELAALRTRALAPRLRRAGHLDGVVQIRIGYSVPSHLPTVTVSDMTIAQAHELPYPEWKALSPRLLANAVERQRRAFAQAVGCCMTTRWAAGSVVDDYGIDPARVHVVGVGRNHEPRPGERDWSTPRFLFVGFDTERKNLAGVLRAFARLRETVPAARLDVVGRHGRIDVDGATGHGTLRLDLEEDRHRLDRLFEQATCFVMPSHCEPSAIAFTEALAAGVPSVVPSVGGSWDLVGEAGRVVDPADDGDLLAALRELSDPETARRLGALALERAPLFTWDAVGQRVLRALDLPGVDPDSLAPFL